MDPEDGAGIGERPDVMERKIAAFEGHLENVRLDSSINSMSLSQLETSMRLMQMIFVIALLLAVALLVLSVRRRNG